MRTIKFRVWDDSPIKDRYAGLMISHEYAMQSSYLIDALNGKYQLMQFTGLQDKNGVDIYDGDIFHCNSVNYILKYKTLGGAYTVHNIKDDTDERFLHHCHHQIEVIGNIYENPELLSTPTDDKVGKNN